MIETELVGQCAPTLAGLKTANLFSCRFEDESRLDFEIRRINRELNAKGVFAEILLKKEDFALIYVYRRSFLERDLQNEEAGKLLLQFGYQTTELSACISKLRQRLAAQKEFPHEIGLFLGYPLADVKGFIRNKGLNCKCCGIWKVYDNEYEAKKIFAKLQKCSRVYAQVFAKGRTLAKMCVAA